MGRAEAVLYVDGASFGNPGPSGIGIVLVQGGRTVVERSLDAGFGTNNEAEYRALAEGLREAAARGVRRLVVRSDSQLLVRQMRGEYRVRHKRLLARKAEVEELLSRFQRVAFEHVPRERNARADRLAKAGAEAAAARGARPAQRSLLE